LYHAVAGASRIDIDLQFGAALLALQIRDDGRGFTQGELETAILSGDFGIRSIQDRAPQAAGTCGEHRLEGPRSACGRQWAWQAKD